MKIPETTMEIATKLGSIAVHAQEIAKDQMGHPFDWVSMKALLSDPDVVSWLKQMRKCGLLPEMRNPWP